MSEPCYRDWILDTIDSLRSRKARPDLERICRMVRRRHGSDPERTRAELEKLIQDRTVLKVSYKGSISYRNAARVQRKGRRCGGGGGLELVERDSSNNSNSNGSGNICNIGNNVNSNSGNTHSNSDGNSNSNNSGVTDKRVGARHERQPRLEPGASASCEKSGNGGGEEEDGGRGAGQALETCREQREEEEEKEEEERKTCARQQRGSGSGSPPRAAGLREVPCCLSARRRRRRLEHEDTDETLTRQRARALQRERDAPDNNNSKRRKNKKKKVMVMMMVRMMKKSGGKTGRAQLQQQGSTATRGQTGARAAPRLNKKKKKKNSSAGGGGGARDDGQSKEEDKDEEMMETETEEEDDEEEEEEEEMEQELEGSTSVNLQTNNTESQAGVKGQVHPLLLTSLEVTPSEEKVELASSSSPSKISPVPQEADSEGVTIQQVTSVNTENIKEEKMAATSNELQTNTQSQAGVVADGVRIPSSFPFKISCKTEMGVSSCLLTPSASPGAAEERVMNGGMFVKSESAVVNPVDWTVADVASYFTAVGFPEQALAFSTQEIDGKSLLLMQRNDVLTGLSIRLGPALKIYERHIKVLQRTHFEDDGAFC